MSGEKLTRRGLLALAPVAQLSAAVGGNRSPIYALDWHPDGSLLAAGAFREVRLFKPQTPQPVASLPGAVDAVRAVAISPDGALLAAGGGLPGRRGEWKVWDLAARQERFTATGHSDCIYAIAFAPNRQTVATASYDKLIKIWDAASGKEIRTLKDHIDAVYGLAYTPDGRRLVSASADRSVKVWNPETGERLYTLSDATDGLQALAIDPEGRRVAAGGADKTIRIWTLGEKSGELRQTLIAHEDAILQLAWSKDQTLASSSADRTVKFFHPETLEERARPRRTADWVMALKYAPDGRRLAAGLFDGSVEVWGEGK